MSQTKALPAEFLARLEQILPSQWRQRTLDSFTQNKSPCFRINTKLTQKEQVLQQWQQQHIGFKTVNWKDDAFVIEPQFRETVLQSPLYQQGLLYSQNLASQLAPVILNPSPGEEVLDLCAAPGGKCLQMACMMKDQGRIGAVEKVKKRFYKLQANIQQQQAGIIQSYLGDGTQTWRKTPGRFDRVLLDAPCSSEARFKQDQENTYSHWSIKKIKETSRKQKSLIYSAVQCLKPGGTLLYCTCSFAPEENEAIVAHALKKFAGQIEILPIELPAGFPMDNVQQGLMQWQGKSFPEEIRHCVRILPDRILDGFFMGLIRRL